MKFSFRDRLGRWLSASLLATSLSFTGEAAAASRTDEMLKAAINRSREIEKMLIAAEKEAAKVHKRSEEETAKRLVEGQLMLAEHDVERAAIVFLDILENNAGSQAASQALYFLGEALVLLDMPKWASECFSGNLADRKEDGRRFHQRSVARLLDLAAPRREKGFARRPGISATPEVRARLLALGFATETTPLEGIISEQDEARLKGWVKSIRPKAREKELLYAYGRFLFLRGEFDEAIESLDAVAGVEKPISLKGMDARWRLRAAYVSAAATLAAKRNEEALQRFERITEVRARTPRDRQIVSLAWMARARIFHDEGRFEDAVEAYRKISRDSPLFAEAMYETAWTLLRGGNHQRSIQALDLLLVYAPDSPLAPEIKQLRGKILIQQREWKQAEDEFLALRREFSELSKGLLTHLDSHSQAADYFSAVVSEDMQHFSLDAVFPIAAVSMAESFPRAKQGLELTHEVGELERELFEVRELLARMEDAVQAKERARLFMDLGAHLSSVDTSALDLLELRELLVDRVGRRVKGFKRYADKRKKLRRAVDYPLGDQRSQGEVRVAIQDLSELAHKYDLTIAALRAQLVATERYYEETKKDQKIHAKAFLKQAAELRDEIGGLEKDVAVVESKLTSLRTAMRFSDPWQEARRKAAARYSQFLDSLWGAIKKNAQDPRFDKLWRRIGVLEKRIVRDRQLLDQAALRRLQRAMKILEEERVNLDRYLVEMTAKSESNRELMGELIAATYRDVVSEFTNLVTRAEVGLLDVAWAIQEVEAEEIRRLEKARDRDLRELQRVLDQGLGGAAQ